MERLYRFFFLAAMIVAAGRVAISQEAPRGMVRVFTLGGNVIAPELLPRSASSVDKKGCKANLNGKVVLFAIVDDQGQPRDIYLIQPAGTMLDDLAIQIASTNRFRPGTKDGTPVAVAVAVELNLQSCVQLTDLPGGKTRVSLLATSEPIQTIRSVPNAPDHAVLVTGDGVTDGSGTEILKVGGDVTPAKTLLTPEAEFSDEARQMGYQGECTFSVIIDRHGMPRKIQLTRGAGHGLDQKAVEAVVRYRFKPAMRNGEPVPVSVVIKVAFRMG